MNYSIPKGCNTANDFTGDVIINSGLVSVASNGAFGNAANKIILNGGGILDANQNIALARDIEVQAGGGVIRTWGSVNTTWTGALTGSGNLRRTDGGTLALNMDGSGFTGTITNERGTLRLLTNDWAGTDFVQTDGGNILRVEAVGTTTINSLTSDRDVVIGAGSRLDIASGSYIANSGTDVNGFWMQGTSAGNDAVTGAITSSSGTLTITNGAATGNLTTTDHRIRVFIQDHSAGNPLTLVKNNNNQLIIDRTNTYSGGTIINGGRINADNLSAFGTGMVTVNSGGQAFLTQAGVYANDFIIAGNGVTEGGGTLGAIRLQNNATVSGNIGVDAAGARIAASAGQSGTHSGNLLGAGNLEINGGGASGTITFSGDTTAYTGTMTVSQGRVNLDSAAFGGSVVVADGAAFSGKSMIAGDLSFGSATGANWRVNGFSAGSVGADDLNFNGTTNTIFVDGAPTAPGPFTIATYTGALSGFSSLVVNNAASFRSTTLNDTGSAITLDLGNDLRTWAGNDATNPTFWDVNNTANWAGGDNLFFNGDTVVFDDSASSTTVAMQSLLTPAAVSFNNNTVDYTVTGVAGTGLSGAGNLVKDGTGALTLGGIGSNFTGEVQVNAGVLNLGNGEALGFNSGITIANDARVNLAGHAPGNQGRHYTWTIAGDGGDGPGGLGAITNSGGSVFGNAGILNLILAGDAEIGGNNGRFDIGRSGSFSGTIDGNGFTFTKVGSNQVVVRGQSSNISYTVNAGLLIFEDFDSASGTELITVNGGVLGTWGNRTIANDVNLTASGATLISQSATGTWNGAITAASGAIVEAGGTVVTSGSFTGAGDIIKTGGGQWTITGSTSIAGNLDIETGTVQIGNLGTAGSLGSPGSITLNNNGLALRYRLSGADATLASAITFVDTDSQLRQHAGTQADKLTLTGAVGSDTTLGIIASVGGNLVLGSGSDTRVREIQIGSENTGQTAFLTIEDGADVTTRYLNIGNGTNRLATVNQTGGTVTFEAGSAGFRLGHWSGADRQYNLSGGVLDATALAANSGEGRWVNVGWDGQGLMTVGGGPGLATLKAAGIRFDRARTGAENSESTLTVLNNGLVEIGSLGTSGPGTKDFMILDGGTVRATDTATWGALIDVVSASTIDVGASLTATQTGIISGSGSITTTGDGTMVLSAINTYTGATTVSAGTLLVTGALGNTAVTVENGATIGGPGSLGGSLTFNPGALLDLNGASIGLTSTDILSVTGSITLNDFSFSSLVGWDASTADLGTYTIIEGGGTVTLSGTTPTISNPHDFGNGKQAYFHDGSLQVVVIPEPTTPLLAMLGLAALMRRRMRRA